MQVSATTQPAGATDADTVVVGVFEGEQPGEQAPAELGELLASGEARHSFKALGLAHAEGKRWLLVGLGKRDDFTPERARVAAAVACERASEIVGRLALLGGAARQRRAVAEALVEGTMLRDYRFERHKSDPRRRRRSRGRAPSASSA